MRLFALLSIGIAIMMAGSATVAAADTSYPDRTITIIVPFAAGGTTDIIARIIGQDIGAQLGSAVVVEDVPGASTIVGTERAAHAAPDGYTLYLASSTPFATNPNFYRKLPYSIDDFEMITLVSRVPLALDVYKKLPISNIKDLISYARSVPGGATIATPGPGSLGEIVNGMTRTILDIPIQNIPYHGAAPALQDVMKGVVNMYYDAISSTLPLYRSGAVKALAITGRQRSPAAPNLPTMVELGYPDFVLENLYGLMAPKGTPQAIIDRLNSAVRKTFANPKIRAQLINLGVSPEASTAAVYRDAVNADNAYMAKMVRQLDIPPLN
jgi:tripartite-type tricarboxylate transporter receptor subunit TctC